MFQERVVALERMSEDGWSQRWRGGGLGRGACPIWDVQLEGARRASHGGRFTGAGREQAPVTVFLSFSFFSL